jgi:hypothetical protein
MIFAELIKKVSGFLSQMLLLLCLHEPSAGRYLSTDEYSHTRTLLSLGYTFNVMSYSRLHPGCPSYPLFAGFRMERSVLNISNFHGRDCA